MLPLDDMVYRLHDEDFTVICGSLPLYLLIVSDLNLEIFPVLWLIM